MIRLPDGAALTTARDANEFAAVSCRPEPAEIIEGICHVAVGLVPEFLSFGFVHLDDGGQSRKLFDQWKRPVAVSKIDVIKAFGFRQCVQDLCQPLFTSVESLCEGSEVDPLGLERGDPRE